MLASPTLQGVNDQQLIFWQMLDWLDRPKRRPSWKVNNARYSVQIKSK